MSFVTVLKVGELTEGEGRTVMVGERLVAVFLVDGQYHAIDDLCPHQGASLGAGCLDRDERHGVTVVCPWHAWRFRLSDGAWADSPRLSVDCFATRVVGDDVQVEIADDRG
jgi:nitrite reductase (NADH) small subunit/3-phenylpropionate/trans-cinnamate dioxygenase ferredoxin subunit